MKKLLMIAVAGMLMLGISAAAAADDTVSENRPVDGRVTRIVLDGLVNLKVRQGPVAALVVSGDARWVGATQTRQSGDTLTISNGEHGIHGNGRRSLQAELTLPALRALTSESLGNTDVSGFSGDDITLTLDGAGSMTMQSNYRFVKATLGGVGSMKLLGLNSDRIDLMLEGAGYVSLSGRTRLLNANLEGLGGLDAQQFTADTVKLDMSGLGNATITAHQSANLNLSGMGSVTVYGKPLNRKVSIDGLGKVSWK